MGKNIKKVQSPKVVLNINEQVDKK